MSSESALQEYAEKLAAVFTAAGFPRMSARVLMTLMVSPDAALTAAELTARLGVSPAAVSGAVKYLETLAMLRRRAAPGSRRELYELPEQAWYTATLRQPPFYDAITSLLPEGIAVAQAADASGPASRLLEMQQFFAFVRTRLPELYAEWVATRA
ncbi:MAG: MarR family transcriptional regulator [Microbacteriaceae bacterium]|nr:MarR family transcriptional regulator [Microbacteriaceae bacterium]MCL2794788.1 MarR family transcriptional regulator [Microbacteriaceae bacterium]